jgi:hypothetical protein
MNKNKVEKITVIFLFLEKIKYKEINNKYNQNTNNKYLFIVKSY